MQRKHRVDQNVLRKTFFSKEGNRTFFWSFKPIIITLSKIWSLN